MSGFFRVEGNGDDKSQKKSILGDEYSRRLSVSNPVHSTYDLAIKNLSIGSEGEKFTDPDYMPTNTSLAYDFTSVNDNWKQYQWSRACELRGIEDPEDVKVVDHIDPMDIQQGALGDCYFLSSLSVLAEWPQRIKNLFVSTEVNEFGCYGIILYKNGIKQVIVVDDFIPCDQWSRPVFTRCKGENGEMWTLLLEKAYAKIHGSYQRIEAGFGHEALTDLTGAPCVSYNLDGDIDVHKIWTSMMQAERNDFAMVAATDNGEVVEEECDNGLIKGHLYGVLSVKSKGNLKLVKIRNPWGSGEFNGDWSDKSPLWTDEYKKHFGWSDADDGMFFMELSDFIQFFDRVSILFYEDEFKYSYTVVPGNTNTIMIETDDTDSLSKRHSWISIKQRDERCYDVNDAHSYTPTRFTLMKIEPDAKLSHFSKDSSKYMRDLHEKVSLQPNSKYIMIITTAPGSEPDLVVSTYGASEMKLTPVMEPSMVNTFHETMWNLLTTEILEKGEKSEDYNIAGMARIEHKFPHGRGIIYTNDSEDMLLEETWTFEFENMKIIRKEASPDDDAEESSITLSVAPNTVSEMFMITNHVPATGWSYASSRMMKFIRQETEFTLEKAQELIAQCNDEGELAEYECDSFPIDGALGKKSLGYDEGLVITYENLTEKVEVDETVQFEILNMDVLIIKGDEIIKSDETTITLSLKPGDKHAIILRVNKFTEEGYSYGYGYSYSMKYHPDGF